MPNVKFVARDFMGMVANLPALKIDVLYESIWTCQAIFRYTHFAVIRMGVWARRWGRQVGSPYDMPS